MELLILDVHDGHKILLPFHSSLNIYGIYICITRSDVIGLHILHIHPSMTLTFLALIHSVC